MSLLVFWCVQHIPVAPLWWLMIDLVGRTIVTVYISIGAFFSVIHPKVCLSGHCHSPLVCILYWWLDWQNFYCLSHVFCLWCNSNYYYYYLNNNINTQTHIVLSVWGHVTSFVLFGQSVKENTCHGCPGDSRSPCLQISIGPFILLLFRVFPQVSFIMGHTWVCIPL